MTFALRVFIFAFLMFGLFNEWASAGNENCLDSEIANAMFQTKGLSAYPNYTEGPAARVQRQHPKTFMYGQSKFIEDGAKSKGFGLCTYYNHVGWILIYGAPDLKKSKSQQNCDAFDCKPESYWRKEFSESYPEDDRPGREMLDVCVYEENGREYASLGCGFEGKTLP